jgi:hypothetical protein
MSKFYTRALCERAADGGKDGDPIRFVASTEGIKRDGKDLKVSSWRLDNYQSNPVVLWVHDYWGRTLPIGRAEAAVEGKQLMADVAFDQADDFAKQVERKYRAGFLNAVSVGWKDVIEGKEIFLDLLDISAVPVPGDPDALMVRQYRALGELLNKFSLNIAPDDDLGEAEWNETAAAMAGIFDPSADDPDDRRQERYNALLPAYRRAGKTPPEFLPLADLRALTAADIDGLFFEGERVGAVLSGRNRGDLEQAITLIQSVLDRAKKEEQAAEDDDEGGDEDERAAIGQLLEIQTRLSLIDV